MLFPDPFPWSTYLDPTFLIMFGLVLAGFAPLLYSVWDTWRKSS